MGIESQMRGSTNHRSPMEMNKLQSPYRNPVLMPVKVEEIPYEPPRSSRNREHLHEEGWQDPICRLFQSENKLVSSEPGKLDEGTSSKRMNRVDKSFELRQHGVKLQGGGDANSVTRKKAISVVPLSLKDVHRPATDSKNSREAMFRDMGFSTVLIRRAIQLHGAQADDSRLLQFLLDSRRNHDQENDLDNHDDGNLNLPDHKLNAVQSMVASPSSKSPQSGISRGKRVATPNWDSDSYSPESDSHSDDKNSCKSRSPIDWALETAEFHKPAPLCKREISPGVDHRQLMHSHGFPPDLVERAIEELGEGVECDMLFEYMLYLTSQQDPDASTSEPATTKQVSTVEKLVKFGFPTKAVERAVLVSNTPLWDAEEDQIADLVDFLTAHGGQLNEEEDASSDEEGQEDNCWTYIREKIADDVAEKRTGKRKIEYPEVSARKSIVRRSRSHSAKREPVDRPPIVKKEPIVRPPRVKVEPTAGRSPPQGGLQQPMSRIGRPRVVKEEVVCKANRHKGSVGFGLPGQPITPRYLSEDVKGAPFFYFENVASMPNDEWERIRRHLFDIEPEFVDSLHFSACRRPRGYIHNLPIEGRKKILDDPQMTIQDLLPHTRQFWPAWDPRIKLNCITTRMGSEFLAKKLYIREGSALQTKNPSADQQRAILDLCRHWNLVWTAPNIPTPISENEIEVIPPPVNSFPSDVD